MAAISESGVSGVAVMTVFVIRSETLRARARIYSAASASLLVKTESHQDGRRSVSVSERRMRSPSLTTPTTRPLSSTTGTALMRWRANNVATSLADCDGFTVTTGATMTSRAFIADSCVSILQG